MGFRVLYHLNTANIKGIPEEARWAEGIGYDGLCTEEAGHDPLLPLLLAATTTSRVTLEPRVAIAFPRSPMVFAYAAMDLQNYSGGRFRLGLGTQVKGHIERRFSTQWTSPGPRIREYVQSLHAIWDSWQNGTRLSYHGDHYKLLADDSLLQPWSVGAAATARVHKRSQRLQLPGGRVRFATASRSTPLNSPEFVEQRVKPFVADGAGRAERDPGEIKLTGSPFIITGPNKSVIEERKYPVRRQIAFYASTRSYSTVLETHGIQDIGVRLHEMSLKGQWEEMAGVITDDILAKFAVVEEYDQVAAALRERYDSLLDEVVFGMDVTSPDDEQQLRGIIADLQTIRATIIAGARLAQAPPPPQPSGSPVRYG